MIQEHAEDCRQLEGIKPHIADLRSALAKALNDRSAPVPEAAVFSATTLQPLVNHHLDFMLDHLRHEENRLSPCLRKNLSVMAMREVVNKVRHDVLSAMLLVICNKRMR